MTTTHDRNKSALSDLRAALRRGDAAEARRKPIDIVAPDAGIRLGVDVFEGVDGDIGGRKAG